MLAAMMVFFTCPVCLDFIYHEDPFGVCYNGHIACSTCTKKMYTSPCPVCRGLPMRIRPINYVIKGLHDLLCYHLHLPCPFVTAGCTQAVLAKDMKAHIKDCIFKTYPCVSLMCQKKRSFQEMAKEACGSHYRIIRAKSWEQGWSFVFGFSLFFDEKVSQITTANSPVVR